MTTFRLYGYAVREVGRARTLLTVAATALILLTPAVAQAHVSIWPRDRLDQAEQRNLISRDNKKVVPAELKDGSTVVVDALGDTYDDLLALEVRLVPPIPSRTKTK
jgi:hypothetical protein